MSKEAMKQDVRDLVGNGILWQNSIYPVIASKARVRLEILLCSRLIAKYWYALVVQKQVSKFTQWSENLISDLPYVSSTTGKNTLENLSDDDYEDNT